jgi:hypothetical protein
MSQLVPLTPPPGLNTIGTLYSNKGAWVDSNLIRWVEGSVRPIGGWLKIIATQLTGTIIAVYPYELNNGGKCIAIGTTDKVYLYNGTLNDITPSGFVPPSSQTGGGYGYGAGIYGDSTYGTQRTTTGLNIPIWQYFFDSWGQTLVFMCNADGKIYTADGTGSEGIVMSNAPTNNAAVFITDERFVVAISAGGVYNRIAWCDRENYTDWTATTVNMAGGLNLNSGSPLIAAVKWRGQNILFSMTGVHLMSFVGSPYVYGTSKITDSAAPISPRAILAFPQGVTWVTEGGIMLYNGAVQSIPCPVWDTFRQAVNWESISSTFAGHNSYNNEVWWWFPTGSSVIPDTYIKWNYKENLWDIGKLSRTAWADSGVWKYPIGATPDGYLVQHECCQLSQSYNIGGANPYISTSLNDVAFGSNIITIDRIIPDELVNGNTGKLSYTISGAMYPNQSDTSNGSESSAYTITGGPYSLSAGSGKIDCRLTARHFKLRIDGPTDKDFVIGVLRARVTLRGSR